jgi:perosamine synthetase
MNIRLFKPCIGQEELENVKQVFDRAWLGLGPMVEEFEKEWTDYIGAKESVAVNSCTAALHLALAVYGFRKGAKVLVPAITFVSTAHAVLYSGLEPVFVDVDPITMTISLEDLERKYTKDCVAVIPVHFGGQPCKMEEIMTFAKNRKLIVIEDCANSGGGDYKGRKLGMWGDIGCFSFEEKKNMTTGDGGMICSNDLELMQPLRAWRWVGIDRDTWRRLKVNEGSHEDPLHWYYEVAVPGYKYNMNDLAAAIGLAQLKKLDWMNQRRAELIAKYQDGIKDFRNIQPGLPYSLPNSAYWLFMIRTPERNKLIMHLKQKGISTGVHFMPLPLHPLYQAYDQDIPVAKKLWTEFVTLPLFPELKDEELAYVVDALREFDKAH